MEEGALAYFDQIDRMGGMVAAIEQGFPQREIAESSYRFQQAVERKEKIIVGVNDFVQESEPPIETLYIDESASERQLGRLDDAEADTRQRPRRPGAGRLAHGRQRTPENLMPPHSRRRPRLRHARRDVRCAARGVGRVRGSAGHLNVSRLRLQSARSQLKR